MKIFYSSCNTRNAHATCARDKYHFYRKITDKCPHFSLLHARRATRWDERDEKRIVQKRSSELGKTARVRLPSSNLLYPRSISAGVHTGTTYLTNIYMRPDAIAHRNTHTHKRARIQRVGIQRRNWMLSGCSACLSVRPAIRNNLIRNSRGKYENGKVAGRETSGLSA